MPATTEELLDTSRRELLDLSTRNRLLSIPVDSSSARIVAVRDEISEQVYRLLVAEKRALSFLPRKGAVSTAAETGEPAGGDTEELRAAILAVIELGHGAAQKEIPTAVARILGFKNTSAQLRYAVEGQIHKLVKQNVITDNNGMFKRAC
jgi:hypothetical protein